MASRVDEALFDLVTGDAGVSAIMDDRLYPGRLPSRDELGEELTFPCARFFRVSGTEVYSHSGRSNLDLPRFQFDVYARTWAEVQGLADAIDNVLAGYKGTIGDVWLQRVMRMGRHDTWEDALERWRVILDFGLSYSTV